MDTRLYDTDEPGPPRGWLGGFVDKTAEARHWQEVVNVAISALEQDGSRSSDPKGELYWGGLRLHDRYWLYHILPAGRDRHGRLGRCLIALFAADRKTDFNWRLMGRVQRELLMLAADPGRLKQIVTLLHESGRDDSLTDQLVGGGSTLALTSIQRHLDEFSAGSSEGGQLFGVFHQDTGVMLRQKCQVGDSPTPREPLPPLVGAVEQKTRREQDASAPDPRGGTNNKRENSMMNRIKILFLLFIAGTLGWLLRECKGKSVVPESPEKTVNITNQKEALESLRKSLQQAQEAADYLNGPLSKPIENPSASPDPKMTDDNPPRHNEAKPEK